MLRVAIDAIWTICFGLAGANKYSGDKQWRDDSLKNHAIGSSFFGYQDRLRIHPEQQDTAANINANRKSNTVEISQMGSFGLESGSMSLNPHAADLSRDRLEGFPYR